RSTESQGGSPPMSDQGLSIFDNEPTQERTPVTKASADEPTQVMPAVKPDTPAKPTASTSGTSRAAAQRPSTPRPTSTPAGGPARPSTFTGPGPAPGALPVVRKGGYDREAVDAQI